MNIVAIIEARMASSRLPGKVMLPILGKPMLAHMVERIYRAHSFRNIIVATTKNPADDAIWNCSLGATKYRGSEDDVLLRVLGASKIYEADVIVELTGDCPLIDPAMIDKCVADYLLGGADFVYNRLEPGTPVGMDVRVFSSAALAEIDKKTDDPADREHVSNYFWEHPDEYICRNVYTELPGWAGDLRLTVDEQADFDLVEAIFEELYPTNATFTLYDILDLFERNLDLWYINGMVTQKAVR